MCHGTAESPNRSCNLRLHKTNARLFYVFLRIMETKKILLIHLPAICSQASFFRTYAQTSGRVGQHNRKR